VNVTINITVNGAAGTGAADPRQIAALVEDKLDDAARQAASRVRGALHD
jgi:hypothetical protein